MDALQRLEIFFGSPLGCQARRLGCNADTHYQHGLGTRDDAVAVQCLISN